VPTPAVGGGAKKITGVAKLAAIAGAVVMAMAGLSVALGMMLKGTGNVSVSSIPPDAEVFLDGEYRGVASGDLVLNAVPVGHHFISAKKPGYVPVSMPVTVTRGAAIQQVLTLEKQPDPTGRLTLKSKPAGAAIYLDGADTGKTTPVELEVPAGAHRVEFRAHRHRPEERKVEVATDQQLVLDIALRTELVNLEVRTAPAGAKVYDRHRKLMGVTPWTLHELPVDPPFPEFSFVRSGCQPYTTSLAPDENGGVDQTRTLELKCP
jgi:hypothetical protein